MRPASILLALAVVLGFVSEAEAYIFPPPTHDYTVTIGSNEIGFQDWVGQNVFGETGSVLCQVRLGPLGIHQVPFTATQGLIGFCLILAMLIIVPAVLTVRWKRKRAT